MSDQPAARVEEVTGLLRAWRGSEAGSSERLFALVYPELKRLAHRQLARERHGHTLQTTALVHEAYLRLVDQKRVDWHDRGHFFAIAATLMRRLLVDYARARLAAKRAHERLTLTTGAAVQTEEATFERARPRPGPRSAGGGLRAASSGRRDALPSAGWSWRRSAKCSAIGERPSSGTGPSRAPGWRASWASPE